MRPRYLLLVTSVLTLVGQGLAQGCQGWNTSEFFESATLAEVRGCLATGVDVNAQSVIDTTPLHYAAFYTDDPAIIRVLLVAGADVNAQDLLGNTPLHLATFRTRPDPAVIEALLDAGADVNARNDWGKTPWDYAQENEALRGTDAWWRLREGGLE